MRTATQLVSIDSIDFREPTTGFTIATVDRLGTKFRLLADLTNPAVGKQYEITGEFSVDEHFGSCFIASRATSGDDDAVLAGIGIDAATREYILETSTDANPFEILPIDVANDVATVRGFSGPKRAKLAMLALLERDGSGTAIRDERLREYACTVTSCSTIDSEGAMLAMIEAKEIVQTSTGHVIWGEAWRHAEELAPFVPQPEESMLVSEVQAQALETIPPGLTHFEITAIRFALNHTLSIIDVKQRSRNPLITLAVIESMAAVLGRPVMPADLQNWPPTCKSERLLVIADLDDPAERDARVLARLYPQAVFKVPIVIDSALDECRASLAANRRLLLTARTSPMGDEFAEDHQGDFAVWHLAVESEAETTAILDRLMKQLPDDYQMVGFRDEEARPSLADLNGAIMQGMGDRPLSGTWRVGDRILEAGQIVVVDPGNESPIDAAPAYVVPIEIAQAQDRTWKTVVLFCQDGVRIRWTTVFSAMRLAETQFIVVGSDSVLQSLPTTPATLPVNAALAACLGGKKDAGQRKLDADPAAHA